MIARNIAKWGGIMFMSILMAPLVIFGLMIIGFFTSLIWNINDQPLDPEVQKVISQPRIYPPAEQNAYFHAFGLLAPADQNPHEVGKNIIAKYESTLKSSPNMLDFDPEKYGFKFLSFEKNSQLLKCEYKTEDCLVRYMNLDSQASKSSEQADLLLQRYRSLYKYPSYAEARTPSMAGPFWPKGTMTVPRLVHVSAASALKQGKLGETLNMLERDIRFWRNVETRSRDIFSKIIAAKLLANAYYLLNNLIKLNPNGLGGYYARIEAMAEPLTLEERSLSNSYSEEILLLAKISNSAPKFEKNTWKENLIFEFFYQPNATINQQYQIIKTYMTLASMPAKDFKTKFDPIYQQLKTKYDFNTLGLHTMYNPAGKALIDISIRDRSGLKEEISRMHDLDGLIRLLNLQLQIRQKHISDAQIVQFLKNSDPRFYDPYTNQPMQWDTKTRTLYFEGLSEKMTTNGRVELKI